MLLFCNGKKDFCSKDVCDSSCEYHDGSGAKCVKQKTNADRIRAMSDEELAALLSDDDRCCPPKHPNCHKYVNNCAGCYLEWLQQPAKEE